MIAEAISKERKSKIPGIDMPIMRIALSKKEAEKQYKTFLKNLKRSRRYWFTLIRD